MRFVLLPFALATCATKDCPMPEWAAAEAGGIACVSVSVDDAAAAAQRASLAEQGPGDSLAQAMLAKMAGIEAAAGEYALRTDPSGTTAYDQVDGAYALELHWESYGSHDRGYWFLKPSAGDWKDMGPANTHASAQTSNFPFAFFYGGGYDLNRDCVLSPADEACEWSDDLYLSVGPCAATATSTDAAWLDVSSSTVSTTTTAGCSAAATAAVYLGSSLEIGPGTALRVGETATLPCARWSPGYAGDVLFACGAALEADVAGCARKPALDIGYVLACVACVPTCLRLVGLEQTAVDPIACAAHGAATYGCEACEAAPATTTTTTTEQLVAPPTCIDHAPTCANMNRNKCKGSGKKAVKKREECPKRCGVCTPDEPTRRLAELPGDLIV